MLVDLIHEFLVVNVSSSNNDDIVTEIVSGVEVLDMVNVEVLQLISISLWRLSHLMFSVDVEMDIFQKGLEVSVVIFFVFLTNLLLQEFEFTWVQGTVWDQVSQGLDALADVVVEYLQWITGGFSASLWPVSGSDVFDVLMNLGLWLGGSTSKEHLWQ